MFNPFNRNPFDLNDPSTWFSEPTAPQMPQWAFPEGIGLGSGPPGVYFPGGTQLDASQINDWRGALNPAGAWAPWLREGFGSFYDPIAQRNPFYRPDAPPDSRFQAPEWSTLDTSYPWGPAWDESWRSGMNPLAPYLWGR